MRRQRQDHDDDEYRQHHDVGDLHRRGALRAGGVHGIARQRHLRRARILGGRARLLGGRHPFRLVDDQLEQIPVVGRPRRRHVLVLHGERLLRVRHAAQPHHLVHAVDGGQVAGKLLGRGLVDALGEQTRVRDAPVERLLHVVERLYRRRVGRQVIGHAVVHLHRRDAQRARHCRHREQRNHRLAVAQERFAKLEHHAPFEQMFHVKHSYHR